MDCFAMDRSGKPVRQEGRRTFAVKELKEASAAFKKGCLDVLKRCGGNVVTLPNGEKLAIYEEPLIGIGSADDELFHSYKDPEVIGAMFWEPKEWLPDARSVIAFFFPFTEAVRKSNLRDAAAPSVQWLYGRIEGQQHINKCMDSVKGWLEEQGIRVCVPSSDERFAVQRRSVGSEEGPDFRADSRWSERHAAYVCGLGTFGLSRGLITRQGIAGRFGSIIVDAELTPDERLYDGVYDYCTKCGACAKRCPVGAITVEHGKNNVRCSRYLDETHERYAPRYGCGKCQTGVPCEHRLPSRQT